MNEQMIPLEDFLEHFGVKGMKWGVHRTKQAIVSKTQTTPRKTVKTMTDTELKTVVDRMRLEQQYIQLKKQSAPPNPATALVKKYGSQAVNVAATAAMGVLIGDAIRNRLKDKVNG